MGRLSGKRAWVTGASGGIGEATARALAAEGADVALSARSEDVLEALAGQIRDAGGGGEVHVLPVDVGDRAAMAAVGERLAGLGGVDVLVNNAGLMPLAPIEEGHVDEWERMIDVNVKGVMYAIHAVLGGMIERRSGHVVNVGSVAGRVIFPGNSVYCGTKFAVRAISDGLRQETVKHGLRVTNIEPGAVATNLLDTTTYQPAIDARKSPDSFFSDPDKLLQAEDIAAAIVYAVTQPERVNVSELLIRPQVQQP